MHTLRYPKRMRHRDFHFYRSNLFECVDPHSFDRLCSRWNLDGRTEQGLFGFRSEGVLMRDGVRTRPLPNVFWTELRRTLAPGASVIIHECLGDFSGAILQYRLMNSDGDTEIQPQMILPLKISRDEWAKDYPGETYPYPDDSQDGAWMDAPMVEVQVHVQG